MALPNDSVLVTPGTGATIATHLVSSKEYQVVMVAKDTGHIEGSTPTYTWWRTFTAGAQNQRTFDIFNASGSGVTIVCKKLFLFHDQSTVTGVAHTFSVIRTSAVGTGGTVITGAKNKTGNPAIHANVTARFSASGGATEGATLFGIGTSPEETLPAASLHAAINWLPTDGEDVQDIELAEGEGLLLKQITNSTVGVWGVLLVAQLV
jgi:hypothetical protein